MINKIKIFWFRLMKKQHCWIHASYTVSCDFCKRI